MAYYCYDITMKTPLGDRHGGVLLYCEQGLWRGTMSLLGSKTELQGTVDERGGCELKGELRTLLRSLPYTASGRLLPDRLSLTLVTGSRSYAIEGKRRELG